MKIPISIGMPRSASRMTWQMLRFLVPKERPSSWYPEIWRERKHHEDADGPLAWPIGGHEYYPDVPVIYTYRHPLEAYLSFLSRSLQDVGKPVASAYFNDDGVEVIDFEKTVVLTNEGAAKNAMWQIGCHWAIYENLKKDQANGRDVLFLKYESYYLKDKARLKAILNFTEADIDDEKQREIVDYVNININEARGRAMEEQNPDTPFTGHCNVRSAIQRNHVNSAAKGRPGYHLALQHRFVTEVLEGNQPAYQALSEMCEALGYNVSSVG